MSFRFSSSREVGNVSKTASVTVFKSDVTTFTPVRTPRVLNEPSTILETNKEDSVVVGVVITVIEDTASVVTPVSSINGDSNRLDLKSSSESSGGSIDLTVAGELVVRGQSSLSRLAGTINSEVRIVSFSSNSIGNNVLEGLVLVTTTTTSVTVGRTATVNELLFRKTDGLFSLTSND